MSDEFLITNLADSLGYILEDMIMFIGNFFQGWMLILAVLTMGFIVIIYFRFFKKASRAVT